MFRLYKSEIYISLKSLLTKLWIWSWNYFHSLDAENFNDSDETKNVENEKTQLQVGIAKVLVGFTDKYKKWS